MMDEPGVVWVMQDSNGNGVPDDVWYELKGSHYNDPQSKHRYAITFFKPRIGDPRILWKDNEGRKGVQSGGYPYSVKGASFTLVLSKLSSPYGASGYVDTGSTWQGLSEFNIADAVQADGTPVDLAFIDFVKVQCAVHNDSGTEMEAPQDMSMPPDTTLTGAALGGGMHRYVFVNSSGQNVTLTVQGQDPFTLPPGASKTLDIPFSTRWWEISPPELAAEASGNTLTVTDGGGGDV
jgi:hypothetical protein